MNFRIFILFVCVSCFNIVSSYRQYQEFGHEYRQHPEQSFHKNYAINTPVYPAHSEPQYVPHHQQENFDETDQRGSENFAESSAQSLAKSNDVEHKPLVYFLQPHQELPRPYPVDNTFKHHVPYRRDYTQHVVKPWVSQNTYQPTVHQEPYHEPLKSYHQPPVQQEPYHEPQKSYHQPPVQQEPYHQPIVYPEQQSSVYQYPPPPQHSQSQHLTPPQHAQPQYPTSPQNAQPQHPTSPQHAQPQHPTSPQHAQPQHPTSPQHAQPQHPPPAQHVQPPHQQTYYKPQPSYEVPVAHAQAQSYATSETNVADILASQPEVKGYLESALLKHYQLDDLGNSHHVKSSDIKLEENDNYIENTTEIPHNYHQNKKNLQKQLLDNDDNQNKKHFVYPPTLFEETKHETIPPKNDDNETFHHPKFAYLNHKENSTDVKTFPIEVKPVNPDHYRNPIVKHHTLAKYSDNNLADEKQKPAVPPTSLGNTDDSYPIELQHSKIYETSTLKDKKDTLYDHNVPTYEQHTKKQPEPKHYAHKIISENDYVPTIKHSKIPSPSKHTDQISLDNPVDKSEDASSHGINKAKDSLDDVAPLLFYSDTIDDTKIPLIESPNFNYEKSHKDISSDLKKQPEVAKPIKYTNNDDVVTDPIVSQKEDTEKIFVTEIDVTKAKKIDDKTLSIHENVSDNDEQKAESKPRSTLHKDVAKQSPIEGRPLNADSPTDDGTSTEQNDDCTSGEIDPNINGDDEEAADSENNVNAVLLSSVDLWEKLFSKQPNTEFQAYNVLTLSPIVDKTSRLFAFPNQTTVEESVETIWACKGDEIPLEIKFTTTIKHPGQKHACKFDKTEQDQTKCD